MTQATKQQRKIEVKPGQLLNMIADVENGKYRIPQFQREYVWPKSKVRELFDSIYQEFPIGSFFLWDAGREHNHLFREIVELGLPEVGEHDDVSFILDGQQRITSLYVTLKGLTVKGIDYSNIVFDLQKEKFRDRKPDNKRYVSVSEIWGPNSMMLSRQIEKEFVPAYERCWKTLQTYPVSLVEVRDKDLPAVCKIFQRINQSGKRLDRFDLISAMTFTSDFDMREKYKSDIVKPLERKFFGAIYPAILTQLLSLIVHGQCTERYEFMLTTDSIQKNWKSAVDGLLLAADTLRKNMGVVNSKYLPYGPFWTLLAYYFVKSGKRSLPQDHLEWVQRWFWRASFAQYYGSGGPTKMGRDKLLFDELIGGVNPVFDVAVRLNVADLAKTRMTWTGSAIRNAFLCLLATRNPVHLENNGPLDLVTNISDFTSNEKHHIFPKAFLDREGPDNAEIHAVPNFCFLPADLNKRISDSQPKKYFPDLQKKNPHFDKAAQTHLLPTGPDSGVADNNYSKFLKSRGELILEEIGRVCGDISTPRQEERLESIEILEYRLRDAIHEVLVKHVGPRYWRSSVPQDVRENAQERIDDALKKLPDLDPVQVNMLRSKLDYLNVMDYRNIIVNGSNWKYFKPVFRSKEDFVSHLANLNEYRKTVMHSRSRSMTELARMSGETAMIWFDTILPETSQPDEGLEEDNE